MRSELFDGTPLEVNIEENQGATFNLILAVLILTVGFVLSLTDYFMNSPSLNQNVGSWSEPVKNH